MVEGMRDGAVGSAAVTPKTHFSSIPWVDMYTTAWPLSLASGLSHWCVAS